MTRPGSADFIKGHISTEHTIWCGRCHVWEQLAEHTVRSTIVAIKRMRWRLRKDWGWLCPHCVREVAEGKTEVGYRLSRD